MLICFFFDSQGIAHKEFMPPRQTVNQIFYRKVLERLRERVARVRPGIARTWMLLHDIAPCHTAISPSINFWQKKAFLSFLSPLFAGSQSLWLLLFPRLKNYLKGRPFGTLDNIQRSVTDELKVIPAEAFQHCYEQWKQRPRCCVAAQGNYFEGDNLDL